MVNKRIFLTSAAFVTLCASVSLAQAETLNEAVLYAASHHPSVRASSAAEDASKQTIKEEKSAYYPRANITGSVGRMFADNTTTRGLSVVRGTGYSWFGEANARLTQTLYDWSAREYSVGSAQARYESLKATTTGAQQTIAIEAASAYLQLLRANLMVDEAQTYQDEAEEYFHRIKTAFENGGADESEVSRAQDYVSLAKNMVVQYNGDKRIAEANYKEAVGRLPDSALLMPAINDIQMPASEEEAVTMAMALNGQLEAAEFDKRASEQRMRKEEANIFPVLEAELSYLNRDQDDIVGGETKDARALIRANWNYAFGGAQKAAQQRATLKARESAYNLEAVQRTIERDIQVAWANMAMATERKANQLERLDAAEQTLETYKEQYEGGQQSLLEMLSAKSAVFGARQDYMNAVFDELNAKYSVMGLVGIPFYTMQTATAQGALNGPAE